MSFLKHINEMAGNDVKNCYWDIEKETKENNYYRRVLFTGDLTLLHRNLLPLGRR